MSDAHDADGTDTHETEEKVEAEDAAEEVSLRRSFSERRIRLTSMELPLKAATAGAFASLLAAAILITLRAAGGRPIAVGTYGGIQMTLSAPLFAATVILISLGFGYVLAGSLFGARWVAAVCVVCLTFLAGWQTGMLGLGGLDFPLPDWAHWVTRGVLVAIWAMAVVVLLVRRGRHGDASDDRTLRAIVLTLAIGLFGAYFIVLWLASPVLNGLTLFPLSVHALMGDVILLAAPVLMIAAIDFAEWGQLAGHRLGNIRIRGTNAATAASGHTGWGRVLRLAVPIALSITVIAIGLSVITGDPPQRLWVVAQTALVFSIGLVVVLIVGKLLRVHGATWPNALSFVAVFGVCAIVTWGGSTFSATLSGAITAAIPPTVSAHGDYTGAASVRSVVGASGYSVLLPVGWIAKTMENIDKFSSTYPDGLHVVLVGFAQPQAQTLDDDATHVHARAIGHPQSDGMWQKQTLKPESGGTEVLWANIPPASGVRNYLFLGAATGHNSTAGYRQLEAIVRSFRPAGQPAATLGSLLGGHANPDEADANAQRQYDITSSLMVGFQVLISILTLAALLVFGRHWRPMLRAAILFLGMVTIYAVMTETDSFGRLLFGPRAVWPVVTQGGLLVVFGIFALIALIVSAKRSDRLARRVPGALSEFLGAIVAIVVIDVLYEADPGPRGVAVWAAILILIAAAWDITMSGETMTNRSSRAFPRASRVLIY
ncbi:MAG: hypothetical protein ABI310_05750, partial [Microbacteriaceae bacterium]